MRQPISQTTAPLNSAPKWPEGYVEALRQTGAFSLLQLDYTEPSPAVNLFSASPFFFFLGVGQKSGRVAHPATSSRLQRYCSDTFPVQIV